LEILGGSADLRVVDMEAWIAAFIFLIVIVYLVVRIVVIVAASRRSKDK